MKVIVESSWGAFVTLIYQGTQRFTLHRGTKEECTWMARVFRKALKNHDAEQINGLFKPVLGGSR